MKIKKLIVLLAVTLVFGCGSSKQTTIQVTSSASDTGMTTAPPPRNPNGRPGGGQFAQQQAELMAALNLDEEQTSQFEAITQKYRGQMREMRANNQGADRSAMFDKMRELRQQQTAELKEILNEQQLKTYEEFMLKRRQNRGPRGRN